MERGHEKPETAAFSVDPSFTAYLHNEFMESVSYETKLFSKRSKCRFGTDCMSEAMKGVSVFNGLEIKISCNSSKASYVLDTHDSMYRARKKRKCAFSDQRLQKWRSSQEKRLSWL